MADGVVFFAGVDLPGMGARLLDPSQAKRVKRTRMGRGGRFVCIDHGPSGAAQDEAFLQSCYMHLDEIHVATGTAVKRGQPIGTVGRSGCKHSPPHLHLEIKSDKRRYDARDFVPNILIGEPPHEKSKRKRGLV
jgi:murein DD-endopeptidase MepM/ murein hydrolase activator NlpD